MTQSTDKIRTADLEPGTFVKISIGRGTQIFFVERVTKAGKPFGQRFFSSSIGWAASSLQVDDVRIEAVLGSKPGGVPAPLEVAKTRLEIETERAEIRRRARPLQVSFDEAPAVETTLGELLDANEDPEIQEELEAVARGWQESATFGGGAAPSVVVTRPERS